MAIPPDPFSAHDIACRGRDRRQPICRCRGRSRSDRFAGALGLVLLALVALTTVSWSTGASQAGAATGPAAHSTAHSAAR